MADDDKDVYGAAKKATSIGPPQQGTRLLRTRRWTLADLARMVLGGDERPLSVAAEDPYGILAWQRGAGPPPLMMGSISEASEAAGQIAKYIKGIKSLADAIEPTESSGIYRLIDPVRERIQGLYRHGVALPQHADWEGANSAELINAFGGDVDKARLWSRLWAANSPGTSVPQNTRESVAALVHTLENPGEPFSRDVTMRLPAKMTNTGAKIPNMNRVLDAAGGPMQMGGDKVEAMRGFMEGEGRLPIDVHALYAMGAPVDKLDTQLPALRALMTRAEGLPAKSTRTLKSLSNTDIYMRVEDALKSALRESEPNRSINTVFGELWEGTRSHKGLSYQGGPIDILRKKGLIEPLRMLDPQRLRAALKTQGWTAGAIAGLMTALGRDGDAGTE